MTITRISLYSAKWLDTSVLCPVLNTPPEGCSNNGTGSEKGNGDDQEIRNDETSMMNLGRQIWRAFIKYFKGCHTEESQVMLSTVPGLIIFE